MSTPRCSRRSPASHTLLGKRSPRRRRARRPSPSRVRSQRYVPAAIAPLGGISESLIRPTEEEADLRSCLGPEVGRQAHPFRHQERGIPRQLPQLFLQPPKRPETPRDEVLNPPYHTILSTSFLFYLLSPLRKTAGPMGEMR